MRLIDADALRKEIADLRVIVTGVRNGKGLLCELVTEYRNNILRVIDNAPTIDAVPVVRWIPVTERLPEIQQKILVYCESKTIRKHVTACTYMGGYLGAKQFSRHVRNVTHWMPLLEPPKEGE